MRPSPDLAPRRTPRRQHAAARAPRRAAAQPGLRTPARTGRRRNPCGARGNPYGPIERRFVGQGDERRSIEQTLDLAWRFLAGFPARDLTRIAPELVERYHGASDES